MIESIENRKKIARFTVAYLAMWGVVLFDWRWDWGQQIPWLGALEWGGVPVRVVLRGLFFGISFPLGIAWLYWVTRPHQPGGRNPIVTRAIASITAVVWWQFALFITDALAFDVFRSYLARLGTGGLFFLGLLWLVWALERASLFYDELKREEQRKAQQHEQLHGEISGIEESPPIVNPLDINAWYYSMGAVDWFKPWNWSRFRYYLADRSDRDHARQHRKLNQSLSGLLAYSFLFVSAFLVMTHLGGCQEIYEMPAGGGEQQTIAQTVKVQKVIKKKFVVNPFSAIRFKVPPIEEIKLQLTELTKHAYTVGYGQGTGAGFAGGTKRGKVRFIRLEYSGGDWNQDFGIGADLNVLIEYGIRTKQKVASKTESRTVAQLRNFAVGKSPPFVFMTGQRNISLSKSEVKILRQYLIEKHGMLFCDNGGSRHFHNQFLSMMNRVLPKVTPVSIPLDDVIHRIPFQIPFLPYVAPHGGKEALGWKLEGRWVAYYHPGDIGDAWADGHAGVSPEVYEACYQLGTNVIFYAHTEYSKWLAAQKKSR